MRFGNGLPRQSADWLAMTGFFDRLKRRRKPSLLLIGRACHCKRLQWDVEDAVPYCFFSSFSSMRVNSSGKGQCSSTGSPVRGWRNRSPVAWRH